MTNSGASDKVTKHCCRRSEDIRLKEQAMVDSKLRRRQGTIVCRNERIACYAMRSSCDDVCCKLPLLASKGGVHREDPGAKVDNGPNTWR
jgi:hypothetical protein